MSEQIAGRGGGSGVGITKFINSYEGDTSITFKDGVSLILLLTQIFPPPLSGVEDLNETARVR